ncbi:MAG: type II toxin-antitoxin system HipA family toxin [Bacteroidetes bacterium]|nr:type II toxin-antitoxin system HipA family toxin [Bacteroidota bacterium]
MKNKCLYCYEPIDEGVDFHTRCSKVFFGTPTAPKIDYTFAQMNELAKKVVERSIAVPGVQPKLSLSLVQDSKEKSDGRFNVVGMLGGNYIFKPPTSDYPELPANEHLTMRIAELFGISVVPSSLIRLASGELSYITKRIDRTDDGKKIHMIDMFQITEAFDKYRGSMEKIGKAINDYSANTMLDKIRFFELTVFCYLTGNNDMHLKNFSMINGPHGWTLAPAYDLLNVSIVLEDDIEELALTISAKKRKLKKSHFTELAARLGLTPKQIEGVYKRFEGQHKMATNWIKKSWLSNEMKAKYETLLNTRYSVLF